MLEEVVGHGVQNVGAFGVQGVADPGKDGDLRVRDGFGQDVGVFPGYQNVVAAGHDQDGHFQLGEPAAGVEGRNGRQFAP